MNNIHYKNSYVNYAFVGGFGIKFEYEDSEDRVCSPFFERYRCETAQLCLPQFHSWVHELQEGLSLVKLYSQYAGIAAEKQVGSMMLRSW
jgi:hypothetical protein